MREWLHELLERVLGSFVAPPRHSKILAIFVVVLGLLGSAWFVYSTGGVQYATLHILYLPIILAALVFGAPGGILAGVCAGLVIGPFMPLDSLTGESQKSWKLALPRRLLLSDWRLRRRWCWHSAQTSVDPRLAE